MTQFNRAIRLFLFLFGLVAGLLGALTAYFARLITRPPRQPLWATPRHFGLGYEDVQFAARDGVRLSGWFVPAEGADSPQGAVILVHGWPWNRLGTGANGALSDLPGTKPVELLGITAALHAAGHHVLMFDLRNHGESAASPPVTFGFTEANDVLGAVDYLQTRSEVAATRVGVLGLSMGANAALFALPRTDQIRAAVLVQPTSPSVFSRRFSRYILGPFGELLHMTMRLFYPVVSGGLRLSAVDPVFAASAASSTPVLYIQGENDPVGSLDDVLRMVAATPGAVEPTIVTGSHHFDGFQYLIDQPEEAIAFFAARLGAEEPQPS